MNLSASYINLSPGGLIYLLGKFIRSGIYGLLRLYINLIGCWSVPLGGYSCISLHALPLKYNFCLLILLVVQLSDIGTVIYNNLTNYYIFSWCSIVHDVFHFLMIYCVLKFLSFSRILPFFMNLWQNWLSVQVVKKNWH